MSVLTDRASLARAFYRLTATSATNPALIEHDGSSLETLYQYLQYGLWDAQEFMLDCGLLNRWVTVSSTLSFSGSDASNGGRYAALPADFIRLAGDGINSALHSPNGTTWGHLIDWMDRRRAGPSSYWLESTTSNVWRLWVGPGASPPSDLVADYHHQLGTLADSTTVEFPSQHRGLIVAFAADRAMSDSWLPGDEAMQLKIAANLAKQKKEAERRTRLSHGPKKRRIHKSGATHYWGA